MSNKLIINAVIALVEDNSKVARDMLRSPELRVSIGEVQSRLYASLQKRDSSAQIVALKSILLKSMRIEPSVPVAGSTDIINAPWSDKEKEIYFMGVSRMESIVEELIDKLTTEVLPERDPSKDLPDS